MAPRKRASEVPVPVRTAVVLLMVCANVLSQNAATAGGAYIKPDVQSDDVQGKAVISTESTVDSTDTTFTSTTESSSTGSTGITAIGSLTPSATNTAGVDQTGKQPCTHY
jgi:hypothetical protein